MAKRRTSASRVAALGFAVALSSSCLLAGCSGVIGGDDGASSSSSSATGGSGPNAEALVYSSRYPRLSHPQWENTVQDLLGLDKPTGLSSNFTADQLAGSFDNNEQRLEVSPQLWADYETAAEELALMITSDPTLLAKIYPANATQDDKGARAFVDAFGARVYRRPLTSAELDMYSAMYTQGTMLGEGDTPFKKGIDLVLQALLQSPYFVYRPEQGTTAAADASVPLGAYELASKLSYMIWNSMPDDELFAAAKAGSLATTDGLVQQAKRMLDLPRGHDMVAAFHAQLFQYRAYHDLYKDPMLFPGFDPKLGDSMETEATKFVDDIVFTGGGIHEILTSPSTYVDAGLAKIYGLKGTFDATFKKTELDPAQRSGFLTHVGFLASKATKREQDSIHRGVFIVRRILCLPLGNPQPNVPPVPANSYPTNRERVDHHTGKGTCGAACHGTVINPSGFAFENYDAVGDYVTTENGHAVDSADELKLSKSTITYKNAIEFSQAIAESDDVHACYAKYWLEYAFGRPTTDADVNLVTELASESKKGTRELVLAIVRSKGFASRTDQGAP